MLDPSNDLIQTSYGISEGGEVSSMQTALDFGAPHFQCLGIRGTNCFFRPADRPEVIELTAKELGGRAMLRLAPLHWWEFNFAGRSKEGGVNWQAVANACMQSCIRRGHFNPEFVTGRGVYIEPSNLKVVAHLGDRLIVDGEQFGLSEFKTVRTIIETDPTDLPFLPPLAAGEASRVAALCEKLDWASPEMGRLFAGWIVIAPVCGALPWRPHIWIEGPYESGKSFALNEVAGRLLRGVSLRFGGSVTEAGIRQELRDDTLPVLFDEAEAKDDRAAQRLDAILELARSAAQKDGAAIVKGGASGKATRWRVRSCFAFASIDVAIKQSADESRIVRLKLRGPDGGEKQQDRAARFAEFRDDLATLTSSHFGPRLFFRTLKNLHTILGNAESFSAAIAGATRSGRLGDVLGPLVAGWYSLRSDARVLPGDAVRLLSEWKWLGTAISKNATTRDHDAALAHLMQSQVALDHGVRRTVAELIAAVCAGTARVKGKAEMDPVAEQADAALRRHGIRLDLQDGGRSLLLCRNAGAIKALFHGTQWTTSPVDTISQNPRAAVTQNPVRFGHGIKQRAVKIDLIAEGYGDD